MADEKEDSPLVKQMREEARQAYTAAMARCGRMWVQHPVTGKSKVVVLLHGITEAVMPLATVGATGREDADWTKDDNVAMDAATLFAEAIERTLSTGRPDMPWSVKIKWKETLLSSKKPAEPQKSDKLAGFEDGLERAVRVVTRTMADGPEKEQIIEAIRATQRPADGGKP